MNEVIQNILTRRSIRNFKPDMPSDELIDQVILAGTYAATGMNRQSPIIIAVTNKEVRDKISALNAAVMGCPGNDPFYGAPVILIVLVDKSYPSFNIHDGAIVMDNMMLAAHSLGLGTCWIHRAKEEFERPEGKALLDSLGIKGEYVGVGHCALGYVNGDYPEAKPRKDNYVYYVR